MLLLSKSLGAHIQNPTALRHFSKQTAPLHCSSAYCLCTAGAEWVSYLPSLCVIPYQCWKVLSTQLWFLFHSLSDTFTMAKPPDARSVWQEANNRQHRQNKILYLKKLPCCINRGPRRGFIFPLFHYRILVWPLQAARCSHTTSQFHGESQALWSCPAAGCSGTGQHMSRKPHSPELWCQNPDWAWQLREGMPQKPQGDFPALVNPWETLPASVALNRQ